MYLFVFAFDSAGSVLLCKGFPLVAASPQGPHSFVVHRLLAPGASLISEHGLQGPQTSVVVAHGSRARARQLWCPGFVASQSVGSPQTRDQNSVCCMGRRILSHWTTREVSFLLLFVRVSVCLSFLGRDFMVLIKCGSF